MDFYDQVIDMDGSLLLFKNGECESTIPTSWVEKDSTGIRFKNEFGQMMVLVAKSGRSKDWSGWR